MSEFRVPADSGYVATPDEIAYEARAMENAIFTGSRVLIGIYAFGAASLAFAYFYLRSLNSEGLWRPHGMTAPVALGAAIMALTVAAAALSAWGMRELRGGGRLNWQVAGWVAVLMGLVALALQCWELTDLSFAPGASGYASCFIGWAVLNMVLLVSGVYWSETLLARQAHLRRTPVPGSATVIRSGFEGSEQFLDEITTIWRIQRSGKQFVVNVESSAYFWLFVAGIAVFFWVFFYVAV